MNYTILMTHDEQSGHYVVTVSVAGQSVRKSIPPRLLESHDAHRQRCQSWAETEVVKLALQYQLIEL